MRHDELFLWCVDNPRSPRYVGELRLVESGRWVSLRYGSAWLAGGFALSEDLPLVDVEYMPRGRLAADAPRAVGAVDDARPDRWGERAILGAGGTLGGAQPKALILIDGQEWIVKFRRHGDPLDSPMIEHASMTLAAQAGIRVAETVVIALSKGNALAVRRFDRTGATRIHSISAGTALRAVALAGDEPALSYPSLAGVLRRAGVAVDGANIHDAHELFRRMVFNILIDNTDDHEKNHALLAVEPERNGRYRLSPAYDVLPSAGAHGYQEFACGDMGHDSTLANAMSQCGAFGLTRAEAASEVSRVIAAVNRWRTHFEACGVAIADIESLAQSIDGDALRRQREDFSADDYQRAPPKVRKAGPFRPR